MDLKVWVTGKAMTDELGKAQPDLESSPPGTEVRRQMHNHSIEGGEMARRWTDGELKTKAMGWIDDWNSHDLDRIMSHYVEFEANTVVARWHRPDGILRGKEELREHFRLCLDLVPNLHFTLEDTFSAPGGYTVVYRREKDNRVIDTVKLDDRGHAYKVTAYYFAEQRRLS